MYFQEKTLDDLLRIITTELLKIPPTTEATRGNFSELIGATLHLTNPRSRLSRSEKKGKVFSALGEWLWYFSKKNELQFIKYYLPRYSSESDDEISVRSGYGERLFNHNGQNQFNNIIDVLKRKKTSRRAVIQLFDASDLGDNYKSIPCTCILQFLIRDNKLHLFVSMRSNDVLIGLPHDIFAFTMIQEIIARILEIDIGEYKHSVGSLHLYKCDFENAKEYIAEDWQNIISMPPMPKGDPRPAIEKVKQVEEKLRLHGAFNIETIELDEYWKDLCRLLLGFRFSKDRNTTGLTEVRDHLRDASYKAFIQAKIDAII